MLAQRLMAEMMTAKGLLDTQSQWDSHVVPATGMRHRGKGEKEAGGMAAGGVEWVGCCLSSNHSNTLAFCFSFFKWFISPSHSWAHSSFTYWQETCRRLGLSACCYGEEAWRAHGVCRQLMGSLGKQRRFLSPLVRIPNPISNASPRTLEET